ncbi:regulator of G protein signaling loco [Trichuris trichiura]|uniref:Regulator of G protein signaling loco n=1 Tax=Trichuris trichiura TaxID=36087 RepID=A0A077ZFU6_TRITR|nr:regulator of G protein signaling loco [Trichuris trichiura]
MKKPEQPEGLRTVLLKRGSKGFGFSFAEQYPSCLSAVHAKGAASLAGLRVGDIVIALNGVDVQKASHRRIVDIVARSGSTLEITVQTPQSKSLCSLVENPNARLRAGRFANLVTPISDKLGHLPDRIGFSGSARSEAVLSIPGFQTRQERNPPRGRGYTVLQSSMVAHAGGDSSSDSSFMERDLDLIFQVVLVYIGSVTVPVSQRSRRKVLRLALHSLKAQKVRVRTVLMKAYEDQLVITNSKGALINRLENSNVAFVAACPENKQYFCVTMLHQDDDSISGRGGGQSSPSSSVDESAISHVFAVDPELHSHSYHYLYAKRFGIKCTRASTTNETGALLGGTRTSTFPAYSSCIEFPDASVGVLQSLSSLVEHSKSTEVCRVVTDSGDRPSFVEGRSRNFIAQRSFPKSFPSTSNCPTDAEERQLRKGEQAQCSQGADNLRRSSSLVPSDGLTMDSANGRTPSGGEPSNSGNLLRKLCSERVQRPKNKTLSLCQEPAEKLTTLRLSNGESPHDRWPDDFEMLLHNPERLSVFAKFLRKEYSEENIEFWMDCEEYKRAASSQDRQILGKRLYDCYFSPNAHKPVNVDSEARQSVKIGIEAGNFTKSLFDRTQLQFDCYRRFLNSEEYDESLRKTPLTAPSREGEGKGAFSDSRRRRLSLPFSFWKHTFSGRRKS